MDKAKYGLTVRIPNKSQLSSCFLSCQFCGFTGFFVAEK